MEIRYQVFVSSTYEDLQEERAEVIQALLELDCIPSGMELFPAANEEQWSWIKRVIDGCDYYIVIIGGRYGSISQNSGQSYTEMEYLYATSQGKPCIGFIMDKEAHAALPVRKAETEPERMRKLDEFRGLVQSKLCRFWRDPADLGGKVSRSITQLIKHEPALGWIRADHAARTNNEAVLTLKNQVLELERTIDTLRRSAHFADDLAQGDDEFSIDFEIMQKTSRREKNNVIVTNEQIGNVSISTTWRHTAAYIGYFLLDNATASVIKHRLSETFFHPVLSDASKDKTKSVRVSIDSMNAIKYQFVALGYLTVEYKESLYGPAEIWSFTPEGTLYFGRQVAIKRKVAQPPDLALPAAEHTA